MPQRKIDPTNGFPRRLFACAIGLTATGIVWLGWIASASFALAVSSDAEATTFARSAERLGSLAEHAAGDAQRSAELESALIESVHLLARAGDDDAAGHRFPMGAASEMGGDGAVGLTHSLVESLDRARSARWIRLALDTARLRIERRAAMARRQAWNHLLGSAGVFGSLAFAWLALTRSLESSRASLAIEVRERIRTAEELEVARDAALESGRLKSAFLRNMSHEIRTPLSIILGNAAELGERMPAPEESQARRAVETIRRAGQRLIDTVDGIMNLAKMESGGLHVDPRPIVVASVVNAVADRFRDRAREKGLAFEVHIEQPEARIVFDERCLERALTNLVDNALKFTARGSIVVTLRGETDGGLAIEVRDTGIGIAEEYRPHLFEPFSQQESGTTRRFEGVGIGLALARGYAEANGARLAAYSTESGSLFVIRVPPERVRSEGAPEEVR